MKRTFVFISFILFSLSSMFANTTDIIFQDPIPPGPMPLSVFMNPVSASISETELAVYFDWSVGTATITVYDDTNTIVHQEVVNTNSTTEVYIPVNLWDAGDYSITVSFGSTNLSGYFQIP